MTKLQIKVQVPRFNICNHRNTTISTRYHLLQGLFCQVIRGLLGEKKYVIVVEHDLAVLDYLSDFICCLYGKPGAYGVVTMPFSVREGINIFLAGFVPTENLRFREEALTFKVPASPTHLYLLTAVVKGQRL
jgi:translation initiation factor RLI1